MNNFTIGQPSLPPQPTPFVGRQDELRQIATLLADSACRLLTLVGPGGIGKTRLAVTVGEDFEGSFLYADGIYFVSLQALATPELIVPAIAEALNFQFFSSSEPREQLLNYLCSKSLLLILDNLEHLLDGVGLLSDILAAASDVKILATSRERLNLLEEWVFDVGGLQVPENETETEIETYSAVQLFMQNARRVRPGFGLNGEQAAIIHICQLVEGMPLGIELAAAWARTLSCHEIARQLERGLDILETPARNMPERHRSMRAVLDQSWTLLSEKEQAVFQRLSVFRGGFTLAAAERVGDATLPVLAALVDKSWLRSDPHGGRYDIHELLRQYGGERLEQSGEDVATRDAYCFYYAGFLQQKWQPLRTHLQAITLDEIEVEFENIRTAWQTMVEKRNTAELSVAVYPLWYFSDLRGRYHEALALFKRAEDALRPYAGDKDVDRVIGQMLALQGYFYVSLGRAAEGKALAEEGLAILQRVGSPEDMILTLWGLCLVNNQLTEYETVELNAKQVIEIARDAEDRWLLLGGLAWQVDAHLRHGDIEKAERLEQEFYDIAETCGDLWMRAMSLGFRQSGIAELRGNYAEGRRLREQGLQLLREVGQACMLASGHCGVGLNAFCTKDYFGAAYHYWQSLKILTDHGGYTYHLIEAIYYVAELLAAQGKKEITVELLTFVLHHAETIQWNRDQAEQSLRRLEAELLPDIFFAAQGRGLKRELSEVVKELLVELSKIPSISQASPDALTSRELEILELLAVGLSNREIAHQLFLALGTVKWYVSDILSKLDVNSRTQAIARARELKLLS